MTLDDRGRRAAHNLRQTVQDAPLLLMEAGIPAARRAGGASRLLSFAGAFAAVVLLVGLTVLQVDLFAPDQETPTTDMTFPVNTTTTTTTVPTTKVPVVPERTTTTTEPPTTTSTTVAVDDVAPDLVITYPENGAVLAEESIRFEGMTEPGAIVQTGPYQAEVDEDGHWAIVLLLNPGGNLAKFTAVDAAGNSSVASVSVTYEVPEPPKEEPPEVEFTAHNMWGSCAENPPYDEYYGTAKPGTTIEVVSEYGSGWTVAEPNGEWYVKVFFETAPPGKTFLVKAKDDFGNRVDFEFVSLVD